MNLITFSGTTARPIGTSPFIRGKQAVIANLSGATVTPQYSIDGTTWLNISGALAGSTMEQVTIPADAVAVRLNGAGTAYLIAGP